MARETARDQIWQFAVKRIIRNGDSVHPDDVADVTGVSDHTARDCLNTMAQYGIIRRKANVDGSVEFVPEPEFDSWLVEERDLPNQQS